MQNQQNDNENDININKISHGFIVKHLAQNESPKHVIILKELSRIIDLIIPFRELQQHGLRKIFYLEKTLPKIQGEANIEWIYIVRPYVEDIKLICKHIKDDIKQGYKPHYPYKVLFSPRKLFICDLIFEQEGVYEYVVMDELQNDLVQIDDDLLSMEYPQFFTNYFLSGDQTWFPNISKALLNIQEWFGKIPNVHMHGTCAKGIYELMKQLDTLNSSEYNPSSSSHSYKIGHLILVDRNIDYITPFCTPLTYEARIDEIFKILAGSIDLPIADSDKTKQIQLSNTDKVFENIRNLHISEVSNYLRNLIAEMKNIYEKKNEVTEISDMKKYINTDLKNYEQYKKLLNLHLNISDIIINQRTNSEFHLFLITEHSILRNVDYKKSFEYIEELINRNFDINKVLKLMILLSKTNDGLSNSDYTQLTNQFLRTYGYDKAFILQKLKKLTLFESVDKSDDLSSKANLLKLPQQLKARILSSNYSSVVKKLDILPGELSQASLKSTSALVDMSYPFNGSYRPILVKYISQMLFPENKTNMEELSKLFPGDYTFASALNYSVRNRGSSSSNSADRTALIFFLGGCSFTEIAVLKKLAIQKNFKFIFATTSFLNSETIIDLFRD